MIIKKILETYLDLSDPKDMFSSNKDALLLTKLTEKFVGICYMSCYILSVNKIIRRSYIYMKDTLDGGSNLSIKFEVTALIYNMNEIINGCKIIRKELNGIIHAKSDYAGIQISVPSNISIFKEGDVVPIIVKQVRYNVNQSAISILAMPFISVKKDHVMYKITEDITEEEKEELKDIIAQIQAEKKIIESLVKDDKKIYNFFYDLLNMNVDKTKEKLHHINLFDILTMSNCIIYKPVDSYDEYLYYIKHSVTKLSDISQLTSVIEYNTKDTSQKEIKNIIDIRAYLAFSSILLNYLSNMQTIKDFITRYPTFKDIQMSKEVFKLYSSGKI